MNKNVLIIAAHPDDEILGCGGTAAKYVKAGYQVSSLILGEGITARDKKRDRLKNEDKIAKLKRDVYHANKKIGVLKTFVYDFPDNRFDSVPLLDIIKVIEKVKREILPSVIFTHFEHDLNVDHRIVYQATITATRPFRGETVKEIYSYEVPSSTEWAYPLKFSPDVFFDVSQTMSFKTRALKEYQNEMRGYPFPRSIKGIEAIAAVWGMKIGVRYAEAFQAVRIIK